MTPGERRPGRILGIMGLWSAMALVALPGWGAEAKRPNLQGAWRFDPDLTARLTKDQQEQAGGGEGGARGHHRSGVPGVGGPQDGGTDLPGDSSAAAKGRDQGESQAGLLVSLDILTIAQQAGQVTITDVNGHSRILKTDGSKVRDAAAPGGPAQLRASWDRDNALLVEVRSDKGSKHTESYIVSNDGKHLYLTLTTDRNSQILRAYDLAPALAPDHQPVTKPASPPSDSPPPSPPPS